VSHVRGIGLNGAGLRKGWGPTAFGKWGSRFSTWVQRGVRFPSSTDGNHLKSGIFAFKNPICKYCTPYIVVQHCIYFSPLQVKINHVTTPVVILGPVSKVANSTHVNKENKILIPVLVHFFKKRK
jgi:hypothetical protein